jgi:hypothetical protein
MSVSGSEAGVSLHSQEGLKSRNVCFVIRRRCYAYISKADYRLSAQNAGVKLREHLEGMGDHSTSKAWVTTVTRG